MPPKKGQRTSVNPKHKTKSDADMERMLARVAELERKGWTYSKIAAEVGVSQPMVSNYMKKIRQRYVKHAVHNREALVETSVSQIKDVMKEAWEALERSKEVEETIVETKELQDALAIMKDVADQAEDDDDEGSPRPKKRGRKSKKPSPERIQQAAMVITKVVTTKKGRLPGVEYMNLIVNCVWKIAILKGLIDRFEDKAKNKLGQMEDFWKSLPGMTDNAVDNTIQQRLEYLIEHPEAKGGPVPPDYIINRANARDKAAQAKDSEVVDAEYTILDGESKPKDGTRGDDTGHADAQE